MIETLVLVDDDKAYLNTFRAAHSDSSWALSTFSDPDEALAALLAQRPDVLILDIRMPMMDGDEFLDVLTETRGLSGCRVFISSAVEPPPSMWRPFAQHNAHFLSKEDAINSAHLSKLLNA